MRRVAFYPGAGMPAWGQVVFQYVEPFSGPECVNFQEVSEVFV